MAAFGASWNFLGIEDVTSVIIGQLRTEESTKFMPRFHLQYGMKVKSQ